MKKAIIFTLVSLGGMLVKAQIPPPDPDTTALHFLIVASIGNLQEISAAKLALIKGVQPDVISFGKMMITDHQLAQAKLMQVAKTGGYQLPAAATNGILPDRTLKNAEASFDQLYLHAMLINHANAVQAFENYAITGKDPQVRAFAQQTLSTLKLHLSRIKTIEHNFKDSTK